MVISYAMQPEPKGLAEAFTIGADFVAGGASCSAITSSSDMNFQKCFFGPSNGSRGQRFLPIKSSIRSTMEWMSSTGDEGAHYCRKAVSAKINLGRDGSHFYDEEVVDFAANTRPSARGGLEITDFNQTSRQRQTK